MVLQLAWASLCRHRTRTLLAILGVAVAAAMLLDMVMMSTGLRESFRELLLSRGFQLRLAPKGTLPFDTDATIGNVGGITAKLRANPAIITVSPVLGGTIHVPAGDRTFTSALLGAYPDVQGDYELVSGRHPSAPNEIAVNDEFARATGAGTGDTMSVATGYDPQLRTWSDSREMIVTGRVRFLYGAANQLAAAVNLPTLQDMAGAARRDQASFFMVKVRDDADVERERLWIEQQVPEVTALSIATALDQVDQRLSYFRQLALILGTVSLFVGFLLVTTLMTVSVNERVAEIAVMRALGVSKARVVRQIVIEGVAITLAGTIAGLGLGLITARYLNGILATFPGLPVAIDFFLFQPRAAWIALGLLFLSGILAGVYPSLRAASLPVAKTLREEAIA